ncbi:TetR/AcrR family transcriptional regulator [Okibacterium endophyticum]
MTKTGSYAKGRAKREEILRVALEVIALNGYRRSSLREIASSVGLSNAGLLHYFGSKEELYAEVLRMRDDVSARADSVAADPLGSLVEVVRHNADVPGLVHLYSRLSAEAVDDGHGAHDYFAERYARLVPMMADGIRAAMADGRIRPDIDPEMLARMLVAVSDGLQVQWLMQPDFDMAAHVDYLLALAAPAR